MLSQRTLAVVPDRARTSNLPRYEHFSLLPRERIRRGRLGVLLMKKNPMWKNIMWCSSAHRVLWSALARERVRRRTV